MAEGGRFQKPQGKKEGANSASYLPAVSSLSQVQWVRLAQRRRSSSYFDLSLSTPSDQLLHNFSNKYSNEGQVSCSSYFSPLESVNNIIHNTFPYLPDFLTSMPRSHIAEWQSRVPFKIFLCIDPLPSGKAVFIHSTSLLEPLFLIYPDFQYS